MPAFAEPTDNNTSSTDNSTNNLDSSKPSESQIKNTKEAEKETSKKTKKHPTNKTTKLVWMLRILLIFIVLYVIADGYKNLQTAQIFGWAGLTIYAILFVRLLRKSAKKSLHDFQLALFKNNIIVGFFFPAWRWVFGENCLIPAIGKNAFDLTFTIFMLALVLLTIIISFVEFFKRKHKTLLEAYIFTLVLTGLTVVALLPFMATQSVYLPSGISGKILQTAAIIVTGTFAVTILLTLPLIALLYLRRKFTTVISFKFVVKRKLSYLAMTTVALGVFVLILVTAIMGGFKTELRKRIRGSLSHMSVPLQIPSDASVKTVYDLPRNSTNISLPDGLFYCNLFKVKPVSLLEKAREEIAKKYELEYSKLNFFTAEKDPETKIIIDPLIQKALKIEFKFTQKAEFTWMLSHAISERFDIDTIYSVNQQILRARAKMYGFDDENDLRHLRTGKDLISLCRIKMIQKNIAEYKESILKLNDPAYRKKLAKYLKMKLSSESSNLLRIYSSQEPIYKEALKILESSSENEKIIAGASGRMRTMALMLKRGRTELDYCQIMAVNPSEDLLISELGMYLQHAIYYEMNQKLQTNLEKTATKVANEFSLSNKSYMHWREVNLNDLTQTGKELFTQLRTSASLISKSPLIDDNDLTVKSRQEYLLAETMKKLIEILNRGRDSIITKYLEEVRKSPKSASLSDEEILSQASHQAAADNPEYLSIAKIRGLIISGYSRFTKILDNFIESRYSDQISINSKFESSGYQQNVFCLPENLRNELISEIIKSKLFIKKIKNYSAKVEGFKLVQEKLVKIISKYYNNSWQAMKKAFEKDDFSAIPGLWSELKNISSAFTTEDVEYIDFCITSLEKRIESFALGELTFWEYTGVTSIEKILDFDFPKVRKLLVELTQGSGPFKGVKLVWDGTVKISEVADKTKFKTGDVIKSMNSVDIKDFEDIRQVFKNIELKQSLRVEVLRNKKTVKIDTIYDSELFIGCKQLIPFHRYENDAQERYISDLQESDDQNPDEIPLPIPPIIIGDRMALYYGSLGEIMRPGIDSRLHIATAVAVKSEDSMSNDYEAREKSFYISSLFHSMFYEDDRRRIYMPLNEALRFLDGAQIEVFVGVKLDGDKYLKTQEYLNLLIAALEEQTSEDAFMLRYHYFSTWEQEKATLIQAVDREEALLTMILSFIILYAGIMIVIIIYLMVKEKTKDIGILKALGGSPDGIQSIFLFNGFFIGFFGALLGLISGLLVVFNSGWIEDTIERIWGFRIFPAEVYYLTYIPTKTDDPMLWLTIALPTVILSFLFALYPAHKAAKMDAVQALQYE